MKATCYLLLLIVLPLLTSAQFGEVRGTITGKSDGLPLPGATISYYFNGNLHGVVADSLGRFKIKPLAPGKYDFKASFITFSSSEVRDVVVSTEKITYVNFVLSPDNQLPVVEIPWEAPLIDPGVTATMKVIGTEEIEHAVSRDLKDLVATTAGVYQEDDGGSLNVRGSREDATLYIVDGIKMTGPFSLPNSAIAEISVLTGGIPAQYGDATGGIVIITTKSFRRPSR
ncbi:MAG TPA: carboxypeptidase regulatory-like domain-containing protein [Bacteroidia bacterium]|nr:carboxypeptidase regulatory-like domain-containing protein [Bacteroidia bacterium]